MERTLKRTAMGAVAALMLVALVAAMPSYANAGSALQQGVQHDRWDRNSRNDHDDHGNWKKDDKRWHNQKWRKGDRLPANYRTHYREVDYHAYRLKEPPRGYHYVRDDRGELLLVGIATGAILGVILSNN